MRKKLLDELKDNMNKRRADAKLKIKVCDGRRPMDWANRPLNKKKKVDKVTRTQEDVDYNLYLGDAFMDVIEE